MTQLENEARALRALLDLLPIGVAIVWGLDCGQITVNAAGRQMLGRDLEPRDLPLAPALEAGAPVSAREIEMTRADGSTFHATASAAPVSDNQGGVIGCVAVFGESHACGDSRAEQFRELALSLADAEARERKRLAQLLHDDFQQLVSAAKLKAGIVRRMAEDERVRGGAEQIEQLLEAAISASRSLTSELNPPVLYDGGLNPAIDALVRSLARQHELNISAECDPRAEPEAEQVRVLLFEAVRELLHNTIRHARARHATVTTGIVDGTHLRIVVADDGCGFDPRQLSADPTPQRRPFGLIEIRERLQWLGGTMHIDSRAGAGTHVQLFMPAKLRASTAVPPRAESAVRAAGPASKPNGHAVRILVADDHAIFREGLISLLADEPAFEVVGEAADGEQAVTLARRLRPDIMLVDVSMPKANGLQVTAQLSRELPGIKIVGLSMHERQDMAAAMRAAGAAAYLTKGGSSDALLSVLKGLAATS